MCFQGWSVAGLIFSAVSGDPTHLSLISLIRVLLLKRAAPLFWCQMILCSCICVSPQIRSLGPCHVFCSLLALVQCYCSTCEFLFLPVSIFRRFLLLTCDGRVSPALVVFWLSASVFPQVEFCVSCADWLSPAPASSRR